MSNPLAQHSAQLDWATMSEINNSHFVIERSYNGREFTPIDRVAGSGNSNEVLMYSYTDNTIAANQNVVYYRLHQFDFDGVSEYTEIRKVELNGDITVDLVNVYPNPFKNEVYISTDKLRANTCILTLVSINGTEVMQLEVNNNLELQKLDMADLRVGIYILNITTEMSNQNFRIIKN